MTIERKVGMGIAGQPSGGATDVAEVFSTYLYGGTGSAKTITNGIDLAEEGGLVWIKAREDTVGHALFDTERGIHKMLVANTDAGQDDKNQSVTAFNSNGFTLGSSYEVNEAAPNEDYVSWTFRKKEKFFDIVTYTGNGTTLPYISQSVSHNLGAVPAMMLVKQTSGDNGWVVYHKDIGNTHNLTLNETTAKEAGGLAAWNNTTPTDTVFTVGADSNLTNKSGQTFVAYLFADNSSEDAEEQMIKCGSYSGTGGYGVTVNLGWEAQWVMVKKSSAASTWKLMDTMRGMTTPGVAGRGLIANAHDSESGDSTVRVDSRGFTIYPGSTFDVSGTYIYMAIRAPIMVEPEAATDVFATVVGRSSNSGGKGNFLSGFPVDFGIGSSSSGGAKYASSRLTGKEHMDPASTAAGVNNAAVLFDYSDGWGSDGFSSYNSWMWKRAKGFMDAVAFNGGGAGATVSHSLGVTPELFVYKRRSASSEWMVYVSSIGATKAMFFDKDDIPESQIQWFNNTEPTSTVFTTGSKAFSGSTFIAYLFATLAGISKVGSYTGNGSNQTISCGFSGGSRFILIKRTDATGDWYLWDSVRGIVAADDPFTRLNTTAAQVTSNDSVDPHNSGFIVNQNSVTNINVSSATYIFYAIA